MARRGKKAEPKVEPTDFEQALDETMRLKSDCGRQVLWEILERCGVYRSTFTGNPTVDAYNEGRRSMGVWLLDNLGQIDDGHYIKLLNEVSRRRKLKARQAEEALDKDRNDENQT